MSSNTDSTQRTPLASSSSNPSATSALSITVEAQKGVSEAETSNMPVEQQSAEGASGTNLEENNDNIAVDHGDIPQHFANEVDEIPLSSSAMPDALPEASQKTAPDFEGVEIAGEVAVVEPEAVQAGQDTEVDDSDLQQAVEVTEASAVFDSAPAMEIEENTASKSSISDVTLEHEKVFLVPSGGDQTEPEPEPEPEQAGEAVLHVDITPESVTDRDPVFEADMQVSAFAKPEPDEANSEQSAITQPQISQAGLPDNTALEEAHEARSDQESQSNQTLALLNKVSHDFKSVMDFARDDAAQISAKLIEFAEANFQNNVDLARNCAGARSMPEIFQIQAAYVKQQMELMNNQVCELRELTNNIAAKGAEHLKPPHSQ